MKRFSALFIVIVTVLCVMVPVLAFAVDAVAAVDVPSNAASNSSDNVNITVMLPPQETKSTPVQAVSDPLPKPTPKPNYPILYPSDVYEFYDETGRQIIKTYELTDKENPAGISRDSFERDGWLYELTDVTKKENAYASTREQTETTTLETATKDTDAIIKLLAPTMEYESDDGYIGVLTLDISSIYVETAGTKKSGYTMTATREYPHLSSNDTSLVPKTITQNGVTYTLNSVDWNTQNAASIDYDQIPTSYTAIAKYTASGSKTTVTGYITTASYVGTVSKILTGRTVYTAYFTGRPIEPPVPVEQTPIPAGTEQSSAEPIITPEPSPVPVEPAPTTEPTIEPVSPPVEDERQSGSPRPWLVILIAIAIAAFCGGTYYFMKRKEKQDEKTNNTAPVADDDGSDDDSGIGG